MSLLTREQIAWRIAQEVQPHSVVNLGIGIPTLVANYLKPEMGVLLHSENGLLGMGPFPFEDDVDADLINAGKQTITAVAGASFFSSADSFAMIRGGHIDLTVLGAMQVDCSGSIANWMVPGKMVKGMGGAMDLVAGVKNVVVAMQQVDKSGESKLLKECTLPLTGVHCISKIVTEMAVLHIENGYFIIDEVAPGLDPDFVVRNIAGPAKISPTVTEVQLMR